MEIILAAHNFFFTHYPPFGKHGGLSQSYFSVFFTNFTCFKWRERNIKTMLVKKEKLKVQQLKAREYKSKLELYSIL